MKLDLNVLKNNTLDITLPTGDVLVIKKPSKGLLIELNKAELSMTQAEDFTAILETLESITLKILSNNTNKKNFTVSDIEAFDLDCTMQQAIFKSYLEFINAIASNPN